MTLIFYLTGPAKDFTTSSNVNSFSFKPSNSLSEDKQSEDIEVPPGEPQAKLPPPPGHPQAKLPLPPGRVSITPPKPVPLATPSTAATESTAATAAIAALKPAPQVPGSVTATELTTPVPEAPVRPPAADNPAAPPPPPKIGRPHPPNPPKVGILPKHGPQGKNSKGASESDNQKAKLKPFFWDKVLANPEQSMVWNEIKAGSFQ